MSQLPLEQIFHLAVTHHQAGRLGEAESLYRQILAAQPHNPQALHMLGLIVGQTGQADQAIKLIRQAIALAPDNAACRVNLSTFLQNQGHIDEALLSLHQALRLNPNLPAAHHNLGNIHKLKGRLDEAVSSFEQALALKPDYVEARFNLGAAWKDWGKLDEAIACFRQALALNSHFILAHDTLLLTLHYHPASTRQTLFTECQQWNRRHAQPLRPSIQPHLNNPDPNRPLRIGYLSPDLRDHPVGRFLLPLLAAHNPTLFQIFCYAHVPAPDFLTAKLQQHAHTWRNITNLSDQQAAHLIRQDQIDILVDLSLHTLGNRLPIFARKPAPIQLTYLGYAGGTALDTIDYRLTDPHLDPNPADDRYYMEKSLRLQGTYWCYQPPALTPRVNQLPALHTGDITFGCLNNFRKLTPVTLKTWAALLQKIPRARLLLHSLPGSHQTQLKNSLQGLGIQPRRLELVGRLPLNDYFTTYHKIDIALDPFPYNGGTTSCEALWMGVPVITLAGSTPVGRAGVSILSNAGFPELIAQTPEEYIQIAVDLAHNLPRLQTLRATLRDRLQSSPLMNAPVFAHNIEQAYRTIWQNWCNRN